MQLALEVSSIITSQHRLKRFMNWLTDLNPSPKYRLWTAPALDILPVRYTYGGSTLHTLRQLCSSILRRIRRRSRCIFPSPCTQITLIPRPIRRLNMIPRRPSRRRPRRWHVRDDDQRRWIFLLPRKYCLLAPSHLSLNMPHHPRAEHKNHNRDAGADGGEKYAN